MTVEKENRMMSLGSSPGIIAFQGNGTRATMKVGIASSREKMKVNFHLRVVRM
jgi:hypothetical protein